jgi:hypothetical protein
MFRPSALQVNERPSLRYPFISLFGYRLGSFDAPVSTTKMKTVDKALTLLGFLTVEDGKIGPRELALRAGSTRPQHFVFCPRSASLGWYDRVTAAASKGLARACAALPT